jgi:hypothetical protein
MFVIEDEAHAELQGEFESLDGALEELRRRAVISWDVDPNVAPCTSWRTCGRRYEVVEYDTTQVPWRERQRLHVLDVSADGVRWVDPFSSS